jgi:hypothetical protein
VHNLTPAPRPIPFERIIQALIFTIVIQVCVTGTRYGLVWAGSQTTPWGQWTDDAAVVWSVAYAFVLGLFLVWAANGDRLHRLLRKLKITHQTSFASEWYGALCQHDGYIVLHLSGERRLLGWPEEWPNAPDGGHFVIAQAQWLTEDNASIDLAGVQRILVRAQDVEMIELMRPITQEENRGRPQATDAGPTTARQGPDSEGRVDDFAATAAVPAGTAPTAAAQEAVGREARA